MICSSIIESNTEIKNVVQWITGPIQMINSLHISINSSRSTISLPLGVSVSQWGAMTPHLIM